MDKQESSPTGNNPPPLPALWQVKAHTALARTPSGRPAAVKWALLALCAPVLVTAVSACRKRIN